MERKGNSHFQNLDDRLAPQYEIRAVKFKGEPLAAHIRQREQKAQSLRGDGRVRRARRTEIETADVNRRSENGHVEVADEDKVAHDVERARDGDEDRRGKRVAQSAIDRAHDVVSDKERNSARADKDVLTRVLERLGRGLHGANAPFGRERGYGRDGERDDRKESRGRADRVGGPFGIFRAEIIADEDGPADRQTEENAEQEMEQLSADPDRGDRARVAELADNHEIDRAVKRLQEIREHKGSGEFQQSDGQVPFDEIAFFVLFGIHESTLSLRLRRRG